MASNSAEVILFGENDHNEKLKEDLTNRLQKRDQSRALDIQQKRALREQGKVTEEKSSFFGKHFQEEMENLHNMLLCDGLTTENRSVVLEHFDAITASFQRLQKFFNDSVMFLPSYVAQKAQNQLSNLLEEINKKRIEMLPKKRFAFKSKTKTANTTNNSDLKDISQLKENAAKKYASAVVKLQDDCVIQNKSGEKIELKSDEILKKDISLSHITNCQLLLHGNPGTVHISDADNCMIVIGPVSGSVFVERCTNSIIATGCQQLRVHQTNHTDFYLHVTSRAIIEDTSDVRFAPYTVHYSGIDEHYILSGLDRSVNNWFDVDDFNWLAMNTQSPNWKILKDENRKKDW